MTALALSVGRSQYGPTLTGDSLLYKSPARMRLKAVADEAGLVGRPGASPPNHSAGHSHRTWAEKRGDTSNSRVGGRSRSG